MQRGVCSVPNCGRPHKARGYCQTHYMQRQRGAPIAEIIKVRAREKPPECTEDGCSEPVKSKGLCKLHYQRLLRHGHTRYRDRKKPPKFCSEPACENVMYALGMCHAHYSRTRKAEERGANLEALMKKQNGLCAICQKPEKSTDGLSGKRRSLAIDHCHETGRARGLLCSSCNRGLGLFQDNSELLARARLYLKEFENG